MCQTNFYWWENLVKKTLQKGIEWKNCKQTVKNGLLQWKILYTNKT
jgi:hypothetical protein